MKLSDWNAMWHKAVFENNNGESEGLPHAIEKRLRTELTKSRLTEKTFDDEWICVDEMEERGWSSVMRRELLPGKEEVRLLGEELVHGCYPRKEVFKVESQSKFNIMQEEITARRDRGNARRKSRIVAKPENTVVKDLPWEDCITQSKLLSKGEWTSAMTKRHLPAPTKKVSTNGKLVKAYAMADVLKALEDQELQQWMADRQADDDEYHCH
ncbi:hypothetical protein [Photobacterium chitinilyticum]|uniref:Uncharacterized protein n=1 Tax=Photobacterium chitinilyticum TaxID=2485123 RepID=A0A444JLX0_9GAMM|nr:hypothetical protein [Photobacterium chitinilyticum]RWX54093.1 hypothetical protein EDI28_17825 [Photobacterium chitinilyticum]